MATKRRTPRNSKSSASASSKPAKKKSAVSSSTVDPQAAAASTAAALEWASANAPASTTSKVGAATAAAGKGGKGGDRLKIGEVARQAGVAPSVITYYVSEGLLPRPVKTSRNMAYYTPETVDRVRLIRELREKAYLPLRVVKKVLSTGASTAEIRESFIRGKSSSGTGADSRPTEAELLKETDLGKAEFRDMEKMGVLTPTIQNGRRTYSRDDTTIVRELAKMRDGGLNSKRGYTVKQMRIYQRAVEKLAQEEIELAIEGVVGNIAPEDLVAVSREWVRSANEILAAMHRKTLRRLVGELGARMESE